MKRPGSTTLLATAFVSAVMIVCSCNKRQPQESLIKDHLQVTWELSGNTSKGPEMCNAIFSFTNTGTREITGKNWTIYFNQNTVMPSEMADTATGMVEHINGDFYRFVPGPSFVLPPRSSLRFEYSYRGFMIKESDAPNGLYVVMKSPGDKKETIVIPASYDVKPFTDFEKVFPGMPSAYPTPENEYIRNSTLTDLPPSAIGRVIPTPKESVFSEGFVSLSDSSVIYYDKGLEKEAEYIQTCAAELFGGIVRKQEGRKESMNSISLRLRTTGNSGNNSESYSLSVSAGKGVIIEGQDPAGVFYGIMTVLSLIASDEFNKEIKAVHVPCCEIYDEPRYRFRGFLLDVARNFQEKEALFKLIDLLAFYKINTLNLRLTDDEGWRIEIEGLPELTKTGARRGHTLDSEDFLPPSFGSGPWPESAVNHGTGFYTIQDYTDIVAYAGRRHITVIPEICFPSHARAAIKSMEYRYRYYMNLGEKEKAEQYRLIDPEDKSSYYSAQLYRDNIACVALPSVYAFYEKIVTELKQMHVNAGYPLGTIHTGGDEVPRYAWTASPACDKLKAGNPGLENSRQLQAYFFRKIVEILRRHGLAAGGWEEVVLGRDAEGKTIINTEFADKNVIPYVWDNTGENIDLGYRIANAGYPVVLCNVTNLYFDLSYNTDPREPGLYWGGFQDARDPFVLIPENVFRSSFYDDFGNMSPAREDFPGRERLKPENAKNIKGLQAQLWSETVKGQDMLEYYVLPKLFAFAERSWAKAPVWENEPDQSRRISMVEASWNEFANRIGKNELPRLDRILGGFNYRIPEAGAVVSDGLVRANVAYPGLTIRYTTDGTEPGVGSPEWTSPLKAKGQVRLRVFSSTGRAGRTNLIQAYE